MADNIRIRVDLDTSGAQQKISDLDKAIKALGGKFGQKFGSSTLARNPELFRQAAEAAKVSGMRYASAGGSTFSRGLEGFTEPSDIFFPFGRETEGRSRRGRRMTGELAQAMSKFERGLARRFKGMEWNFPGSPSGYPNVIHRPPASDAEMRAGQRAALGMGPLRTGTDWKQAGLGAVTAAFSPWLGARMLNQAFGGFPGSSGGGAGGGKGGGLLGAMFGGGASGFTEWYLLIRTIQLLTKAFQEMMGTIHKGSELYRQAAATATSTQKLAHLQAVLGGIGLSPETANRMVQQGQYGRGGKVGGVGEIMMRAHMGAVGMGEMQQIMNMRKEIEFLIRATAFGSKHIAAAAAAMNRMNMDMVIAKVTWEGFWSEFVKAMEPAIRTVLVLWTGFWAAMTVIMQHAREIIITALAGPLVAKLFEKVYSKIFPSTGPDAGRIGGTATQRPESAWEKMGLLINGGLGGRDYARQTAENTKKIADHVSKLFPIGDTTASGMSSQPNFNLP